MPHLYRYSTILFSLCFAALPARAGELDDFEADSSADTPIRPYYHSSGSPHYDCQQRGGECLGERLVVDAVFTVTESLLGFGLANSTARVDYAGERGVTPRLPGEPLLPNLRLDGYYQQTNIDAEGGDLRLELGNGPIALQARHTRYYENNPRDELGYTQIHLMARLSFGDMVGLNLGVGGASLEGNNYTSGASFTAPILLHPSRHFGLEFRPTVSYFNDVAFHDWDTMLMFTQGQASLLLGYRVLENPASAISGPYAGLSFHY